MEFVMRTLALTLICVLAARTTVAQSAGEHVHAGDSAFAALKPADALTHFQAALA